MSHMDVLAPLVLYQRLRTSAQGAEIEAHLLVSLQRFYRPDIGWMVNSFPRGSTEVEYSLALGAYVRHSS